MYSLIFLGFASAVLVLFLTPLVRNAALRLDIVDKPDQQRKVHTVSIPRLGGVAIFAAIMGSYGLLLLARFSAGKIVWEGLPFVLRLLPAALIVFGVGVVDDISSLGPWKKLIAEVFAAILAWCGGIQVSAINGHYFAHIVSCFVTLVWIVACTNAINLIDGVDGLAAGVSLFAALTTLIAALLNHNIELALVVVPLCGALLGFLRFNSNPATIFLGDCGSLTLGFLLGCCGAVWSEKSSTLIGLTAPLVTLSIPFLDTGIAIIRRFLRCQPIFGADHGHIHHKLLARGLTSRSVVILIYTLCGLCGALALLQSFKNERFGAPIIILLCVGACIAIQNLGYREFEMARRVVFRGNFRRQLNAELQLSSFQDKLTAAATPGECWEVLQGAYGDFGFNEIRLKLGGHVFTHTSNGHHIANTWTARIKLSESDYLNLSREFDSEVPPIVARFTDAIGRTLGPKTSEMLRANSPYRNLEGKTTQGLVEMVQERRAMGHIREVAAGDLLGRNPVSLEEDQINAERRSQTEGPSTAVGW